MLSLRSRLQLRQYNPLPPSDPTTFKPALDSISFRRAADRSEARSRTMRGLYALAGGNMTRGRT